MSAGAQTVDAGAAAPAKKGKKKLVIMLAIALLVVLAGGGAAVFFMKKKGHDALEAQGDEGAAPAGEHAVAKHDAKHPPIFLPLDPFVVNLADKEAERYAQIGITLEVEDAKFADDMKAYMPAIRNGILMILAHKTSRELLERAGKEQLAGQIQREAARTMGIEVEEPAAEELAADEASPKDKADGDDEPPKPKAKPKGKAKARKAAVEPNPVRHVHFSNFIIQ
jgi:flagellar protein FliL